MLIGLTVKNIRKSKGLNQKDLAKGAGISQTYLSQLESDKKNPTKSTLEAISDMLEVPLPVICWLSLTELDVHQDKIDIYRKLKPTMDSIVNDLFIL